MNESPFILNERFYVDPSLGMVDDRDSQKSVRIEPRLMNLLCLLVARKETLVSRAVITKEIWDDYGNADEGLTQAISYLRKVLADDNKSLIETVPKKGYILHGVVSQIEQSEKKTEELKYLPRANRQKYLIMAALVFVLLLAALFVFKRMSQKPGNADVIQLGSRPAFTDTARSSSNPDQLPDTTKKAQTDADKVKN